MSTSEEDQCMLQLRLTTTYKHLFSNGYNLQKCSLLHYERWKYFTIWCIVSKCYYYSVNHRNIVRIVSISEQKVNKRWIKHRMLETTAIYNSHAHTNYITHI